MKRRIGALALFLAVGAMTFAGAGISGTAAKKPKKKFDPTCGKTVRQVNHTMGTTTITGTPKRVVALEFSFVDDLGAIGVKPVGIADDNQRTRVIPKVRAEIGNPVSVGLRATPNLETIASLHPDLIIADADRHATILPQLQKIAPTIVLDSLNETFLPQLHAAKVIGLALNKCGLMNRRIKQSKLVMQRIAKAVPKDESRKAFYGVASKTAFNANFANNYVPSILDYLGIGYALDAAKKGETPTEHITLEDVLTINPAMLFVADAQPGSLFQEWKKSPLWATLKATQNKAVYVVNDNLWSRARGIQASELIGQQAVHLLYHKYVSIKLPKVS